VRIQHLCGYYPSSSHPTRRYVYLSADSGVATIGHARGGVQITRFGITPVGHLDGQIIDHNGGSVRAAPDED
jgi:hypothetical protein